jgi:HNH endonuclease
MRWPTLPANLVAALKAKSAVVNGPLATQCWLWRGGLIDGYAQVKIDQKTRRVHRIMYELHRGPIPDGLTLDHLCRCRSCINPGHVEPVENKVNVLRGVGHTARNARKTHCPYGHPFSGDNLLIVPATKARRCRTCTNKAKARNSRERYARERLLARTVSG